MCILFDTALKKKDVYVLFSPILLTICYNPYPKNKQHATCSSTLTALKLPWKETRLQRYVHKEGVQAMSFPVKHRATQSKFSVMLCFPLFFFQLKMNARSPNERSFFFTEH